MAYSDKVIDHYSNPKNVGTLDKGSKSVGTGLVGAPVRRRYAFTNSSGRSDWSYYRCKI
jgi:hypothetical protein